MAARPKRLAHVLGPSRGGIRRHVHYLASNPPSGYETVVVRGPGDDRGYFDPAVFRSTSFAGRLRIPGGADIVHAHGFKGGLIALRRRRPPVVLTVHIDLTTQGRTARSSRLRALAQRIADRADAVIAVSEHVARSFPRARVIPPATDLLGPPRRARAEVRAEFGTPPDRVVVATVARLHPDKGLDVFIDAVDRSGAEGWICGDGPLRASLEQRCRGTSVRLLGYRDDVAEVLGAADVFALPSVGEAYGIAVVEAITIGLPTVVSDAGAMPEIVEDAGLVVASGDAAAFANAVQRVVSDGELRAELAERAREISLPEPKELVQRIGEIYDDVLS